MDLASKHFLDFSRTQHAQLFDPEKPAWEALKKLPDFLRKFRLWGKLRDMHR